MKLTVTSLLCAAAMLLCGAPASAAIVTIGDFETAAELAAWNPAGNVSLSGPFAGANPTSGTSQARLSAAVGGVSNASVEAALGLTAGSLNALAPNTSGVDSSSFMFQNVVVTEDAGLPELAFNWTFMTTETANFRDTSFVSIFNIDTGTLVDPIVLGTSDGFLSNGGVPPVANPNAGATTYNRWSENQTFTADLADGNYRIGFGVIAHFNEDAPSDLFIDSTEISFTAVPEPGAGLLCLLGAGVLGLRRRRS